MSAATSPASGIFVEAHRVLDAAAREGLTVRLMGGLAVYEHAPGGTPPLPRDCKDIDLVTTRKQGRRTENLLCDLGYTPNAEVNSLNSNRRLLFCDLTNDRQLDVFVDGFEMCHSVPIADRLDVHPRAIPLAELLLTKLQIVALNDKDRRDIVSMLVSHDVTDDNQGPETLSGARIAELCAADWGPMAHRTNEPRSR